MLSTPLSSLPLLLLLCSLSGAKSAESEPSELVLPDILEGVSSEYASQAVFQPTTKLDIDGGSVVAGTGPKHGSGYVPLPVENPSKSFWLDTPGANPLAEEGSTGELTRDADVCVIGSGITGVSAAWHLSKLLGDATRNETFGHGARRRQRSVVILERAISARVQQDEMADT